MTHPTDLEQQDQQAEPEATAPLAPVPSEPPEEQQPTNTPGQDGAIPITYGQRYLQDRGIPEAADLEWLASQGFTCGRRADGIPQMGYGPRQGLGNAGYLACTHPGSDYTNVVLELTQKEREAPDAKNKFSMKGRTLHSYTPNLEPEIMKSRDLYGLESPVKSLAVGLAGVRTIGLIGTTTLHPRDYLADGFPVKAVESGEISRFLFAFGSEVVENAHVYKAITGQAERLMMRFSTLEVYWVRTPAPLGNYGKWRTYGKGTENEVTIRICDWDDHADYLIRRYGVDEGRAELRRMITDPALHQPVQLTDAGRHLVELNRSVAISESPPAVILVKNTDVDPTKGLQLQKINDFQSYARNRLVREINDKGKVLKRYMGVEWQEHPLRNSVNAITYCPGAPRYITQGGLRSFNSWRDDGVPSVPLPKGFTGDPRDRVKPFLDYLMNAIGDEEEVWLVIQLLAFCIQNRSSCKKKILYIPGSMGAGKGVLVQILTLIFGPTNVRSMTLSDWSNKFNSHCTTLEILYINESDEITEAQKNQLKHECDEATLWVNPKHIVQYQVPNVRLLIISSNDRGALQFGEDDRRIVCAEMDPAIHHRTSGYWTQFIDGWIKHPTEQGAGKIRHFLESFDYGADLTLSDGEVMPGFNQHRATRVTSSKLQLMKERRDIAAVYMDDLINNPRNVIKEYYEKTLGIEVTPTMQLPRFYTASWAYQNFLRIRKDASYTKDPTTQYKFTRELRRAGARRICAPNKPKEYRKIKIPRKHEESARMLVAADELQERLNYIHETLLPVGKRIHEIIDTGKRPTDQILDKLADRIATCDLPEGHILRATVDAIRRGDWANARSGADQTHPDGLEELKSKFYQKAEQLRREVQVRGTEDRTAPSVEVFIGIPRDQKDGAILDTHDGTLPWEFTNDDVKAGVLHCAPPE